MTNTQLKTQIDTQITNETVKSGITPTEVGNNIKAVVDYADQQDATKQATLVSGTNIKTINGTSVLGSGDIIVGTPVKTAGVIDADNVLFYKTLEFDLNTVNTTGASDKVILPTTTDIGKEVLVFAANNANAFSVRGNVSGTAVLSPGGVSSQVGNISVAANISYRFIHLGSGYWKAELI